MTHKNTGDEEKIREFLKKHPEGIRLSPLGEMLGFSKGAYVCSVLGRMADVYEEDNGLLKLKQSN